MVKSAVLPVAFPTKVFTFPVNPQDVINYYSGNQDIGKLQDGFFAQMAKHKQYDEILKVVYGLPKLTLDSILDVDLDGDNMFHIMAQDTSVDKPFRMAGQVFEILMQRTAPLSMDTVDKSLKTPNLKGQNFYQLADARGCMLKDDMKGQSLYVRSCFYVGLRPPTSAPKPVTTNSLVPGATA